ncbi:MAG: cupredoxin domain-containing protein [Gaiellaceae bacterium]
MRRIVLIALVSLALAACGDEGEPVDAGGGAEGGATAKIVLTDFALAPDSLSLDPGSYTMRVVNEGDTVHALKVDGPGGEFETAELQPGESANLALDLSEPGEYELTCPVGDHRERGMEGTLTVGGGGGGGSGTTTEDTTTEDDDGDYRY